MEDNLTEFVVKLAGLNPMTVFADTAAAKGDLIQFLGKPNQNDMAPVLFTVNINRLEYFGPAGKFTVASKKS